MAKDIPTVSISFCSAQSVVYYLVTTNKQQLTRKGATGEVAQEWEIFHHGQGKTGSILEADALNEMLFLFGY